MSAPIPPIGPMHFRKKKRSDAKEAQDDDTINFHGILDAVRSEDLPSDRERSKKVGEFIRLLAMKLGKKKSS